MALGRSGAAWRRAREICLRGATECTAPDCRYPGVPLDPNDKVTSPRHQSGWRPGRLYPTADHLVPVALTEGWSDSDREAALQDPRYLRPVHLGCNAARGMRPLRRRYAVSRPTRDWGV